MTRKLYKVENQYIGIVFEDVSCFYINEEVKGSLTFRWFCIEFRNNSKRYFELSSFGKAAPEAEEIYKDLITFWKNN